MQIDWKEAFEQVGAFAVKYISIPALVALFIKITVQIKRKQATVLGVASSLFVGLCVAYLTRGFIHEHFKNEGTRTILIAFVAIMSDKIAEYLIFEAEVNKLFDLIGSEFMAYIRSKFRRK